MKNKLTSSSLLKNNTIRFVLLYTIVFAVTAVLVFFPFYDAHATFVWNPDGTAQHYTAFIYFGKYLREIVRNLLAGNLIIPQYDFSMGLGSDVLQALHYYVIGDPLNLVSVLIPSKYAAFAYTLLMLFRYYLAGLAFCAFAKYKKMPTSGTIAGALIYIFTSYSLYMALRHPSFLNPLIYFPLILLGIEMIFDKKRPYLFIVMIFISAMSSFYFFYVISIFTVLYIFVRLFFQYKNQFIKNLFTSFLKFGSCYLLGVLMASIIFVPIVLTFLQSSRGSVEYAFDLFFASSYYNSFINAFAGTDMLQGLTLMGYTALGFVGLIILFPQKKKHTFLKLSFIILTVFMMFPAVMKIVNGFSYVTNRWVWVYGLLIAYMFTTAIKELKNINIKQAIGLCAGAVLFFIYTIFLPENRTEANCVSCIIFFIFAAGCLIYCAYPYIKQNAGKKKIAGAFNCFVIAAAVLAVFCNSMYHYNPNEAKFLKDFMGFRAAINYSYRNGYKNIQKIQNTENAVERYEDAEIRIENFNCAILNETYSTTSYFSLNNTYLNNFQKEMGLVYNNYSILGTSACDPFIQAIENVKYYVADSYPDYAYKMKEEAVEEVSPNGIKSSQPKQFVFENESYVPFGFTYKNAISEEDYNKLNSTDKRNALIQAVVLEEGSDLINTNTESLNINRVSDSAILETDVKGIEITDSYIYAEDKATINVSAYTQPNSQVYCVFNNIRFIPIDNVSIDDFGNISIDNKYSSKTYTYVEVNADEKITNINTATPYYDYYTGISDFTINLGYHETSIEQLTIRLSPGYYTFDSIEIISESMDDFDENINALSENTLQNLEMKPDCIRGTITADEDEILFLSIPYSDYWTAYVDGTETEIHRANTAFSAISLTEGEHTIEMKYSNTSIKKAALLSTAGILIFAGVVTVYEINKKKKENAQ